MHFGDLLLKKLWSSNISEQTLLGKNLLVLSQVAKFEQGWKYKQHHADSILQVLTLEVPLPSSELQGSEQNFPCNCSFFLA